MKCTKHPAAEVVDAGIGMGLGAGLFVTGAGVVLIFTEPAWKFEGTLAVGFGIMIVLGGWWFAKREQTRRTGDSEMSSKHLMTDEVSEGRIETALAGIREMADAEGAVPAVMSEFELARVFAERFDRAFFARAPCSYEFASWFFRPGPGVDEPRVAHREARHACMQMIAVLASAHPETGQDRVWLERRKTVEDVLEIASWNPRLSYRPEHVEDVP